jgi:hypothetical protein
MSRITGPVSGASFARFVTTSLTLRAALAAISASIGSVPLGLRRRQLIARLPAEADFVGSSLRAAAEPFSCRHIAAVITTKVGEGADHVGRNEAPVVALDDDRLIALGAPEHPSARHLPLLLLKATQLRVSQRPLAG